MLESPLYNSVRDKFPSPFENVVLGSLKPFPLLKKIIIITNWTINCKLASISQRPLHFATLESYLD